MNKEIIRFICCNVKNMVETFRVLRHSDVITEEQVESLIKASVDQCANSFGKIPTEEEVEEARKKVFATIPVYEEPGIMMAKQDSQWFSERKTIEHAFADRYKTYLLSKQDIPQSTIETMFNNILPAITDQLGDPVGNSSFSRKGLVIGNIQSGKTSNYIGLMCNAADAGYKVIILLSGTIETLRKQTQTRVEEGFIGFDSEKNGKVGVGISCPLGMYPVCFTSHAKDFVASSDNNSFNHSLEEDKTPSVFVIKKNVSVLKKVFSYLQGGLRISGQKLSAPLLLIDDEADNASINTKDDMDPTRTNEEIRRILSLFKKSTYVGYTATPFANVFILPESKDSLQNEDLFPKDFIYYLDVPRVKPGEGFNSSHYIGPEQVFINDHSDGVITDTEYMVQEIMDNDDSLFPTNHKKDFVIQHLFPSFYDSIREFCLANTIRDLRGDKTEHRTMLINMSRFINIQKEIAEIANSFLSEIVMQTSLSCSLPYAECMKNPSMISLQKVWDQQFNGRIAKFTWKDVAPHIFESIKKIKVDVVNSGKKEKLLYDDNKEKGLRVIAVGGLALSRGLTLQGLMTSYFYRNTETYDVLMQMGRWFGYRPNYADLCRLWITGDSCGWYKKVTYTIQKLHEDIFIMNNSLNSKKEHWTPLNFGIRVWNASNGLNVRAKITEPKKMKNTEIRNDRQSFFGKVLETPYFSLDVKENEKVKMAFAKMNFGVGNVIEHIGKGQKFGIRNIESRRVIDFLSEIQPSLHPRNSLGGVTLLQLLSYLNKHQTEKQFSKFDIVFYGGESERHISIPGCNEIEIKPLTSGFDVREDSIRIRGEHIRLGSKNDTDVFLAKKRPVDESGKEVNPSFLLNESYFLQFRDKPLLMIYFIELTDSLIIPSDSTPDSYIAKETYKLFKDDYLIGLGLGIQGEDSGEGDESYVVNSGADYYKKSQADESYYEPDEILN